MAHTDEEYETDGQRPRVEVTEYDHAGEVARTTWFGADDYQVISAPGDHVEILDSDGEIGTRADQRVTRVVEAKPSADDPQAPVDVTQFDLGGDVAQEHTIKEYEVISASIDGAVTIVQDDEVRELENGAITGVARPDDYGQAPERL